MKQILSEALNEALVYAVDDEFYHFIYPSVPSETDAFAHYVSVGWKEGLDPNPWFSTNAYLARVPGLRESNTVPLLHYLTTGADADIEAQPSVNAEAYFTRPARRRVLPPGTARCATVSQTGAVQSDRQWLDVPASVYWEFDAEYYLASHADVAAMGIDPLLHYLRAGWLEGRDPNAWFSGRAYLEANPDIAESGVNPFLHYLRQGREAGRPLKRHAGFREEVLSRQLTVPERIAAVPSPERSRAGERDLLAEALGRADRSGHSRLHITVSHDDFTVNLGGLQSCLLREARGFERAGYDHLHIYPVRPLLFTNHEDEDPIHGVLVNGKFVGEFNFGTIGEVLRDAAGPDGQFEVKTLAIHSLLGHNVQALTRAFEALSLDGAFFWIHDFASICAGHNLLRDDVEYCGAPPLASAACSICIYGQRRVLQVGDHQHLFERLPITVVAPAAATMETWSGATQLPVAKRIVHPHAFFVPIGEQKIAPPGPLRVAFLGFPHVHKGWPVFREIALRFGGDERYQFFHLGKGYQPGLPIAYTEIEVSAGGASDMAVAIDDLGIDVALIWSICPETFCFTAHEAIAGGAAVIATMSSGNLTRLVKESGKGLTLPDENALFELFESGEAMQMARSNRAVELFDLQYSSLTADLITMTSA